MEPMDFVPVDPPDGLTEAVLRRTSGSPCKAAEERLCDLVDGTLADVDADLVLGHLGTCAPCAALARALAQLQDALPAMQAVDPGRGFTAAVIERTSRSRRSRLTASFRAMLLRPSFALEGAYLGSLVLVGMVALPGSPLKELPQRAAHAVVATADQAEEGTRVLDARASTVVQGAERRAERFAVRVRELKRNVERSIDTTVDSMRKKMQSQTEETP